MRQSLLVLAVAAMLVLAGCSGTGGSDPEASAGEAPGATETPADQPEATISDPTELSGVSEDDVNATALFVSHARTLANESSYATSDTYRIEERGSDNESVTTKRLRSSRSQQRSLYAIDRRSAVGEGTRTDNRTTYWLVEDGSATVYNRYESDGSVSYETDDDPYRNFTTFYRQSSVYDQTTLLFNFELSYDGTVDRDGRTLFRFTADSFAEGSSFVGNATDPSATVLVDGNGIVRSAEWNVDVTRDGRSVTITYSYQVDDVGDTSVEEPDWLDDAR